MSRRFKILTPAILVLFLLPLILSACGGEEKVTPTPTPTRAATPTPTPRATFTPTASPAPTPRATPTPAATATPTATPEEIPANFTTYTDEAGLFSISYPQDWEPALELIPDLEASAKALLGSLASGLPLERASAMFFAGLRTGTVYNPNVNIVVESLPGAYTVEEVARLEIMGVKYIAEDYESYSEVEAVVGGREARIFDHEFTIPGLPRSRFIQMFILEGKVVWAVTCTATPEKFPALEETFDQIVKSFRLLY